MAKLKSVEQRRRERLAWPRDPKEGGAEEYWVIEARNVEDLVEKHDELAAVGWRALGGACYSLGRYIQSMIRTSA